MVPLNGKKKVEKLNDDKNEKKLKKIEKNSQRKLERGMDKVH